MVFPFPDPLPPQPKFEHEDLVADRIANRSHHHFWEMPALPEGSTPKTDDMLMLLAGMPNHGFFPVSEMEATLTSGPFKYDKAQVAVTPGVAAAGDAAIDIKTALQYGNTEGLKPFRDFVDSFVSRVLKPASEHWSSILTLGGADGVSKCFDVLVNPGDTVLFEEFTFNPLLNACKEKGGVPVPIKLSKVLNPDTLGLMDYAEELEHMLVNWDELYPGKTKPKCLYTIPNGHNPLTVAQTPEHKKKLIALAEKYNFFIIEDDPYGYLNFQPVSEKPNYELTNDEFIEALHPSMLQYDTTGIVCRVETFSKIFAPGVRLGYCVAHPRFIDHLQSTGDVLTRAPSGVSQALVYNTIQKMGGLEGWIHSISLVRNEYQRRKNIMVKAFLESEAGKKGYIKPIDPACGMFVALTVATPKGETISEYMRKFIVASLLDGIVQVPGVNMTVDKEFSKERAAFVRICVSYCDDSDFLLKAVKRISDVAVALRESSA